jgi:hypothetical protein
MRGRLEIDDASSAAHSPDRVGELFRRPVLEKIAREKIAGPSGIQCSPQVSRTRKRRY